LQIVVFCLIGLRIDEILLPVLLILRVRTTFLAIMKKKVREKLGGKKKSITFAAGKGVGLVLIVV
jgi:hypothetical protein